jgi:ABC-type glycerol-3-phosphate transport system substrate-binding protein
METKYIFLIGGVFLVLLLLLGLILALRGRGDGGGGTTEPATLTVWRLFDKEEVFEDMFADFISDHPNVTIVYERKNPADYEAVFTNAIAGDRGPDILSLPNDWMVKHKDKLVPAPDNVITASEVKDLYVNVVSQDAVFDDQVFGLPLYVDSLALYYNLELFTQALTRVREANPNADITTELNLLTRPPTTWDDLAAVVRLVTQRNGAAVTTTGLAMGTADTTQASAAILQALMLQNGAAMANADRSAASFHLPSQSQTGSPFYPGTEALDFYTAFAKPDRTVYNWNNQLGSSLEVFMNRKAAMMINFQFVQQDLAQRSPTLQYGVAPLPQIKGATEPVNVASYLLETVTKNSPHPELAWELVRFMTRPERVVRYRSATRRPSAIRSQVQGNSDAFPQGAWIAQSIYKPDAVKYDEYFREMIRAVVDLRQPPQTAIDVAANKVTQLLLGQP